MLYGNSIVDGNVGCCMVVVTFSLVLSVMVTFSWCCQWELRLPWCCRL